MAKQSQVPMTLSISAMAEPLPGEAPILTCDFGSYGKCFFNLMLFIFLTFIFLFMNLFNFFFHF